MIEMSFMIVYIEWNNFGWTRLDLPKNIPPDKSKKERILNDSQNFCSIKQLTLKTEFLDISPHMKINLVASKT